MHLIPILSYHKLCTKKRLIQVFELIIVAFRYHVELPSITFFVNCTNKN